MANIQKIFTGMSQGPEAIQANFDELVGELPAFHVDHSEAITFINGWGSSNGHSFLDKYKINDDITIYTLTLDVSKTGMPIHETQTMCVLPDEYKIKGTYVIGGQIPTVTSGHMSGFLNIYSYSGDVAYAFTPTTDAAGSSTIDVSLEGRIMWI